MFCSLTSPFPLGAVYFSIFFFFLFFCRCLNKEPRKYLQECARINFHAPNSAAGTAVSAAADLERLYREMADYRWNISDVEKAECCRTPNEASKVVRVVWMLFVKF